MSAVSSETDGMRHGPRSRVTASRRILQIAASGPVTPECPVADVPGQGGGSTSATVATSLRSVLDGRPRTGSVSATTTSDPSGRDL